MSTTSQAILMNQRSCEEQDHRMPQQMGFFPFPQNLIFPPLGCHQSFKALASANPSLASHAPYSTSNLEETLGFSSPTRKPRKYIRDHLGGHQLLSLHRSNSNLWAWGSEMSEGLNIDKRSGGDEDHKNNKNDLLGVSSIRIKNNKSRRKVREPRFCFKTMSDVDVLDDGYKWRKYGQKVVKNTQYARSYYRCTEDNCRVKKRVERLVEDPRMVITTYEGRHKHSPSNNIQEDSHSPSHLNNFFW